MCVNLEAFQSLKQAKDVSHGFYMKNPSLAFGPFIFPERAPGLWIFIMFGRVFDQVQFFGRGKKYP